jgi:hypothetical protein
MRQSKICSLRVGAAVGVKPPQAAERPGANIFNADLTKSLVQNLLNTPSKAQATNVDKTKIFAFLACVRVRAVFFLVIL